MENFNKKEDQKTPIYLGHEKEMQEISLIKDKILKQYKDNFQKTSEEMKNLARKLRDIYTSDTCQKTTLWHVLAGGTPPDTCTKFDFDGEDSIYKYFLNLKNKLKG